MIRGLSQKAYDYSQHLGHGHLPLALENASQSFEAFAVLVEVNFDLLHQLSHLPKVELVSHVGAFPELKESRLHEIIHVFQKDYHSIVELSLRVLQQLAVVPGLHLGLFQESSDFLFMLWVPLATLVGNLEEA